ncbi:hypothetical protein SAMN05216409_1531, partial [Pseudomonas lutea]
MSEYILDGRVIHLSSGEYVCEMIGWRCDRLSNLLDSANDNEKRVAELEAELAEAADILTKLMDGVAWEDPHISVNNAAAFAFLAR